jgi:hypothetical protein
MLSNPGMVDTFVEQKREIDSPLQRSCLLFKKTCQVRCNDKPNEQVILPQEFFNSVEERVGERDFSRGREKQIPKSFAMITTAVQLNNSSRLDHAN